VFFGIRKKLPRVEYGKESERESRSENTKMRNDQNLLEALFLCAEAREIGKRL
jgi:hypothetical protein